MASVIIACILAAGAPAFDTAEAAAIAGLRESATLPRSQSFEAAGIVYRCGDAYTYSDQKVGNDRFGFKYSVRLPDGAILAALFHTHPHQVTEADPTKFSPDDMAQADKLGVPSYILVVRYREVRRYSFGGKASGVLVGRFK